MNPQGCLTPEPVFSITWDRTLGQVSLYPQDLHTVGMVPSPQDTSGSDAALHLALTRSPAAAMFLNPDSNQLPHTFYSRPCWVWLHGEHLFWKQATPEGFFCFLSPEGIDLWHTNSERPGCMSLDNHYHHQYSFVAKNILKVKMKVLLLSETPLYSSGVPFPLTALITWLEHMY